MAQWGEYRLGRDPEPLTWGYTPFRGSAGACLSRLEHLVATFEAMARCGASHPQGRSDHHASAGSGTNGDDLPVSR